MSSFMNRMKDAYNKLKRGTSSSADVEHLTQKVIDCTSEYLLNTDWGSNMELCDMVNTGNVGVNSEKVLCALTRRLDNPNPRVQMLALTVSEACVKNCGPAFHEQLAVSNFFDRIRRLIQDTHSHRSDAQVCNKSLMLVEDWARALPYTAFPEALQDAMEAGAHVPARAEADKAPLLDAAEYDRQRSAQQAAQASLRERYANAAPQPEAPQRPSATHQGGYTAIGESPAGAPSTGSYPHAAATMASSQRQQQQQQQQQADVDPDVLAALTDADRAAVLAAMSGPEQDAPAAPLPEPDSSNEGLPAFDCSASPEQLGQDLVVAAENAALLKQMLEHAAPGDAQAALLVAQLARRCEVIQERVVAVIQASQHEDVLNTALQVHEELTVVLGQRAAFEERRQGTEPDQGAPGTPPAAGQPEAGAALADAQAAALPAAEQAAAAPPELSAEAMDLINFDSESESPVRGPAGPGAGAPGAGSAVHSPAGPVDVAAAGPKDPFAVPEVMPGALEACHTGSDDAGDGDAPAAAPGDDAGVPATGTDAPSGDMAEVSARLDTQLDLDATKH